MLLKDLKPKNKDICTAQGKKSVYEGRSNVLYINRGVECDT